MKYKSVMPYILWASSVMFTCGGARAQNISENNTGTNKITHTTDTRHLAKATEFDAHFLDSYNADFCLDLKTNELCDIYIDNMVSAQQRLNPLVGKRGYRAAINQELPNAPVGMHCVYGQYVHLKRALDEMGDTLNIIPENARRACANFKSDMRKKYSAGNGYDNCIFEGRMFESDSAYIAERAKYLKRMGVNEKTPSATRDKYMSLFATLNFCINQVAPGTMLIVPRYRGSRRSFHMIMFVGRGYIKDGAFIQDKNGRPVYASHNSETMGYLFDRRDTSNVFAANTRKIVRTQYAMELNKINNMAAEQLIKILGGNDTNKIVKLRELPTNVLRKMARDKYLEKYLPRIPNRGKFDNFAMNAQWMRNHKLQHVI